MSKTTAFAPGHISGFFQPVYHKNIYQTGSRGAGINLNVGVMATVETKHSDRQKIDVFDNKTPIDTPVVIRALHHLLDKELYHVKVQLSFDLPISQGFGMSAASALSASLALTSQLHYPFEKVWRAAHRAEIELKMGLGDVAAQIKGGVEIRKKPGIPPWGQIVNIPGTWEIILCTVDTMISTSDILKDKEIQNLITTLGKISTDSLLEKPTFQYFMELSKEFTIKSNLVSKKVHEAIDAISPYGGASMSMLGNSVFASGTTEKITEILSSFGNVQSCHVDQQGARIITDLN